MTRIMIPLSVRETPCAPAIPQGMTLKDVLPLMPDMFPSGKRGRAAARAVCDGCPVKARRACRAMAENMQIHDREGKISGGFTGTADGDSWDRGRIIT